MKRLSHCVVHHVLILYDMYLQVLRTFLIIESLENGGWTSHVISKLIVTLFNDFIVAT